MFVPGKPFQPSLMFAGKARYGRKKFYFIAQASGHNKLFFVAGKYFQVMLGAHPLRWPYLQMLD